MSLLGNESGGDDYVLDICLLMFLLFIAAKIFTFICSVGVMHEEVMTKNSCPSLF